MKVLHVIPTIVAADGGPSQMVLGVCRALRRSGLAEAEIATTIPRRDAIGQPGRPAGPQSSDPEVPVWEFPRSFSEAWKYSAPLGAWLRAHARQYDLIHAHAVFTYSTLAARVAALRADRPLVITPHGMLSPWCLARKRGRKFCYWHLVEKHNVRTASSLHATTPGEQAELRRLLPGARIEWINLGLDPVAWESPREPNAFRRRYNIPEDRPLVLFLGRLHSVKGLADMLLPALVSVGEAHLAVVGGVGPNEPRYANLARAKAARLGLSSRVTFTGAIYGDGRWSAYDDADVFVVPSSHENFGITVIEAMARGTPCLVTDAVKSSIFVEQVGAGTVVARQVGQMSGALRALLALPPSEREAMGRRGREFVRRELTWAHTAQGMARLYRDICANRLKH